MKVLQVNKLYYPHIGGVENHVRELVLAIKDRVEVKVLVASTGPIGRTELIDGVEVTKVASLGRLRSSPIVPTFGPWLRRLKSDIFHFHFPFPTGELAYLRALPPGKLVVTYHSDIIRQRLLLRLYAPYLRKFLNFADRIIASSPNMVEHSPFLHDFQEKCTVVPFGVDLRKFEMTSEIKEKVSQLRTKYGPRMILFLGRLIYYKGLEHLVVAMKEIDANLVIAGSGPLEHELRKMVSESGLRRKVDFVSQPRDEDIPAYYHACDVFVLPSVERSEAFGIVQLEAMACGKPVVSTNLPTGVPFVNLDEETGLIVPPRSSTALADAVNRLLEDESLRTKLGAQGRARVQREFTRELMANRVLQVYEEITRDLWREPAASSSE
jgi:rhamnosyl/mannosyltransferase